MNQSGEMVVFALDERRMALHLSSVERVVQAAEKVIAELCARAAKLWEVTPEAVAWRKGEVVCLDLRRR